MTVISHTYGFIFVHVPKSGGTSVVGALEAINTYRDLEVGASALGEALRIQFHARYGIAKHSSAVELKRALGSDWDAFQSFAVIRSPLDRVASLFAFLKHWTLWAAMPTQAQYVPEFDRCESLEQFVETEFFLTPGPDRIFEPQAFWVLDEDGQLAVDQLIHLDRLSIDLPAVLGRFGVPAGRLEALDVPRLNISEARFQTPLSAPARERVLARYAADVPLEALALEGAERP